MFTYPNTPPNRDFTNSDYALYRVRQISRDTRENPPYSLSDEEWLEILEDTKLGTSYQVFKAVHWAISTNPERLSNLSEASGSYSFSDLEKVKSSLLKSQRELNVSLGLQVNTYTTPVIVRW